MSIAFRRGYSVIDDQPCLDLYVLFLAAYLPYQPHLALSLLREYARPETSAYLHHLNAIPASRRAFPHGRALSVPSPSPPAGLLPRHRGKISCITRRRYPEYALLALIDDGAIPAATTVTRTDLHLTTHDVHVFQHRQLVYARTTRAPVICRRILINKRSSLNRYKNKHTHPPNTEYSYCQKWSRPYLKPATHKTSKRPVMTGMCMCIYSRCSQIG